MRKSWQRHLVAFLGMALGSAGVFGFVLVMNSYTSPPPAKEQTEAVAFKVEKKPKKKKRRQRPKPKRQRPQRSAPKAAPTPNLASGISSVAIDLPGFDSSQFGSVSDSIIGQSNNKNMVMDENSVDTPPKPLSRVAPSEYPPKARREGITGYVTMNLLIGTGGDVERVKVLDAKPSGVFESVAVSTIRQWRFAPAEYQSEFVKVWAKQTMRFELN